MANSALGVTLAILGLLVFGALNTLTTKLQFTMFSIGSEGHEKLFTKPWFGTFAMFVGMASVLLVHMATTKQDSNKAGDMIDAESKTEPLLANGQPQISELTQFFYVGIPAMFDLMGSGLMFIGLLYVSASIWQMLRGSMIIFGAIISVTALGRKLYAYNWLGVFICCMGICCVGVSNILNSSTDDASSGGVSLQSQYFGMAMIVGGQVITASQVVAEEKLLKDVCLPPMKVVGYEGVWGAIVCMLVVFPVCYAMPGSDNGHFEDLGDSIVMIQNSSALQSLILLYIFSCGTYNCAGMSVTSQLSAVHRTMLEASRTAGIWAIDLFVHYCIDPKISFGEAWMPYSWLQLVGFVFLLIGQLVYSGQIVIPGLYYPPPAPMVGYQSPASLRSGFPLSPPQDETKIVNDADDITEL